MANDVTVMSSVQGKVRERIQQSFMDLVPPELWENMVSKELESFTKTEIPKLVQQAAREQLLELLKAEFSKNDWMTPYGSYGNSSELVSEMVSKIVKDAAPELVKALFGSFAQNIVQGIKNGNLRAY